MKTPGSGTPRRSSASTELKRASTPVGAAIRGMEEILGESGMLAYLSYMAQRLIEVPPRAEGDRQPLPTL